MRTQVTFILRLWIDLRADLSTWEGQVECIADGARAHVRGGEQLAQFIEAHAVSPGTPSQEETPEKNGGGR